MRITREELRKQFKEETGTFPVVGARQPYSKHIEWLEDKLIEQSKPKNNGDLGDVSDFKSTCNCTWPSCQYKSNCRNNIQAP